MSEKKLKYSALLLEADVSEGNVANFKHLPKN
jgi:hypothetical protein